LKRSSKTSEILVIIIALTTLLAVLLRGQYQFYLQRSEGDEFLAHWVANRAFLIDDISPYSENIAARIQAMAVEYQVDLVTAEFGLVAPIYVELLFIPFALIENYLLARVVWILVLELSLMAVIWLSLRVLDWQPNPFLFSAFLVFSTLWYPAVRSVGRGSLTIIVALLMISALAAIRSKRDELAGILLAISTIQPQTVFLMIFFMILWAQFGGRKRLLIWFAGSWLSLIFLGMLMIPNWPLQYISALLSHLRDRPLPSILTALVGWLPGVGHNLGIMTVALAIIALLWGWWIARAQRFRVLVWTACITITLTIWIISITDVSMLVMLTIVFALIFSTWSGRWPQFGPWASAISMLILTAGSWVFFLHISETSQQLLQIIIFLPALLLMALIWVRWWFLRFPEIR